MTAKQITTLRHLQQEIRVLRSLLIGVAGADNEGAYNPALIRELLSASREPPTHTFKSSSAFLAQLQAV